jgi:hypothetical protein
MSNFDLGAKRKQKQASGAKPTSEELRALAKERAAKSTQRLASVRGFDPDHLMSADPSAEAAGSTNGEVLAHDHSAATPHASVQESSEAVQPTVQSASPNGLHAAPAPAVQQVQAPAPVQPPPVAAPQDEPPFIPEPDVTEPRVFFTDAPEREKFRYPIQPASYFNPDPDWSSGFNGGLPERTTFRHSKYVKDWLQDARKEIERRNIHADSEGEYSRKAPRMTDSVLIRVLIELGFAQLKLDAGNQKIDETVLRAINALPVSPDLEIYAEYQQSLPPEGEEPSQT